MSNDIQDNDKDDYGDPETIYRTLFERSPIGMILADKNGNVVDLNRSAIKIFGYGRDEIIGMNAIELIHPEDLHDVSMDDTHREMQENGVSKVHRRYIRKDGTIVHAEVNLSGMDDNFGEASHFVMINDISKRVETTKKLGDSNHRMSALLNAMPDLMFQMDLKGNIMDFKGSKENLIIPPEDVIGTNINTLFPRDLYERIIDQIEKATRTGEVEIIVYKLTMDGVDQYFESRIAKCGSDSVLAIVRNITGRKLIEKRVQYRNRLDRAVSDLSNIILKNEENSYDQVLEIMGKAISANRAYIFMFRDEGSRIDNTNEWCKEGTQPQIDDLQDLDSHQFQWWTEKLQKNNSLFLSSLADLPPGEEKLRKILEDQEIRSLIVVPIRSRNGLIGFMGFDDTEKEREWKDMEVDILKIVSDMISSEIQRRNAIIQNERSLERFREMERIAHIGSWEMDLISGKTSWSDEFYRICGYQPGCFEPDSKVGMGLTHPEDREMAQNAINDSIESGKPYRIKKRIVRPDGETRWVLSVGEIIHDDDRKSPRMVGSFLDITDRKKNELSLKKSEEKYRELFESSSNGIVFTDMSGRIEEANNAFCDILGYESEELLGKRFHQFTPDEWLEVEEDIVVNRIFEHGYSGEYRKEYIRKDGTRVPVDMNVWLNRDENGNPKGMMAIVRDLSDHIEAEANVQREKKRAEFYLDLLCHDLGNIHQGLSGALTLMKYNLDNRQRLDASINIADNAVHDSINLTKEVMLLTKVMNEEPKLKNIDVKSLITSSMGFIQRVFPEKEIEFELDLENISMQAEPYLKEVFNNILHNAVRLQREHPWVRIRTERKDHEILITISDRGPGIKNEMKKDLFRRYGIKGERTRTGLGLSIVRALVHRYDGTIHVEDRVEGDHTQGTRFVMRFPSV